VTTKAQSRPGHSTTGATGIGVCVLALIFGVAIASGLIHAILLVVGIWLLAAALASPRISWALYFICISLTGLTVPVGSLLVKPELFGFIFLFLGLRQTAARTNAFSRAGFQVLPILGAFAYLTPLIYSSVVRAPVPAASLWITVQVGLGVLAFLVVIYAGQWRDDLISTGTMVIGGISLLSVVGYLLVAVVGVLPPGTFGVGPDLRLIGFSLETNIFAAQAVCWLAVLLFLAPPMRRYEKVLVIALLVAVVLAGTRSAWLAGALVAGIWTWRKVASSQWLVVVGLSVLVLVAVVPAAIASAGVRADPNSLLGRLSNLFDFSEGTGAYRVNIYDIAWQEIQTWPRWLHGSGMNSYSQFHLIDATGRYAEYLGNIWLATLYDGGGIALAGLLLLVGSATLRARVPVAAIVVISAVFLCSSSTNAIWFQFPWIYMAMAARAPEGKGLTAAGRKEILNDSVAQV
jgi:O-antigen ligase